MKILITGATGFIGNNLISKLVDNKSYDIIATSRNLEKAKAFHWFNQVTYIPYDLNNNNLVNLNSYFGNPDKVIHLAWEGLSNYNDPSHMEILLFNHYNFVKNLIQNGLKDIVITGTCFEYGLKNGILSENSSVSPSNSYAISKDTLHKFIFELKKRYSFNFKWVRLFYMYGEGQSEGTLISLLNKAIENKDKEFNMSGGEQLRDYLYINDVVRNLLLITMQETYVNQAINCCSGKPISIRSLVEGYLSDKKYRLKLNLGYYPYPNYEPMAFWGDNSILKKIEKINR